MNGDCHDLNSYITSGLKIDVLRNFVDRIKVLNPTEAELAVLAALALFSPGYRDTKIPPEDSLLLEEYQVTDELFRVFFYRNSNKFSDCFGADFEKALRARSSHHVEKIFKFSLGPWGPSSFVDSGMDSK